MRTNIGIKRHTELYCEECKLCLPERVSFDIHMGVNHKEKDLYICEICGKKTFEGLQNYENHHCDQTTYFQCEKCSTTFNTSLELEWHLLTEHEVECHAFPCESCKEVFASDAQLVEHTETHKKESSEVPRSSVPNQPTPVPCFTCGISFVDNVSLENHVCRHRQEEPTKCDQCDFKSTNVKEFVAHLLKEHRQYAPATFACGFCDFLSVEENCLKGI